MQPTKRSQELAAMKKLVAERNEQWARARAQLLALGDRVLAVPRESLVRIDEACAPPIDSIPHPVIRV